jgi:succinoglycan biosynthesis protein ExoA
MTEMHRDSTLVVIPTLNEAAHIHAVLDQLDAFMMREAAADRDSIIVVADGGSTDGTQAIVESYPSAKNGRVILIDNPDRFQSAGINYAVDRHGDGRTWLIRIDAHAHYPEDYCDQLIAEAQATGAASVVVPMRAVGDGQPQAAIALAQNSRLGNGGASHRTGEGGRYVDHGHHALMRLDAFRTVGGYDPRFRHNEDAELDLRLSARGYKIWQTARTGLDYIPRTSFRALAKQYAQFGAGRAATLRKHRIRPRLRQMVVGSLAPLAALTVLAPIWLGFAVPAVGWALACLIAGQIVARAGTGVLVGVAAGVMHLAWSVGFWRCILTSPPAHSFQNKEVTE